MLGDTISKITLFQTRSAFLGFSINDLFSIMFSSERCSGFTGFRPDVPQRVQFLKIDPELKGSKLSHYNVLPSVAKDSSQVLYDMEWDLELCGSHKLISDMEKMWFHIKPIQAAMGITIVKLKNMASEKQASILAVKQGRTRIKNAKRLEKKNSDENPQSGSAPGDASKEMTELKTQMAKMQKQLEQAQQQGQASSSDWQPVNNNKKSYYDKEKGGARKGDKGDKGEKGKKGDKGDKGKGKGKKDKGKGMKK